MSALGMLGSYGSGSDSDDASVNSSGSDAEDSDVEEPKKKAAPVEDNDLDDLLDALPVS